MATHISRRIFRSESVLMLFSRAASTLSRADEIKHFPVVVLGGGAGGCSMASRLCRLMGPGNVAVVEPSKYHSYQPMFTLIGAGATTVDNSERLMKDVLPRPCVLYQSKVFEFDPERSKVTLDSGDVLNYKYLVIALGINLDFGKVEGLLEGLESDPMICSNYSRECVEKTFPALQAFNGGHAIFTLPNTQIKCPGSAQFMYLADEYWRNTGVREKATLTYKTSNKELHHVKKYADSLQNIIEKKNINVDFQRNLIKIDHKKREATFQKLDTATQETETCQYDFIHVTPPMSAPAVFQNSKAPISDESGYLDLDPYTLQHTKYANIFGLGDCTNLPTSKTAAAISTQSCVLLQNIQAIKDGRVPIERYDGYTSCPVVTGYNKCILAEFDYNKEPLETLPLDQSKERWLSFQMKEHLMPELYWRGLLTGHWNGPKPFRKLLHLGMCQ